MKVIMFSGQGAQKVGMGKDIYDSYPICKKTFDEASEAVGFDMAKLCFYDNDLLNQTEYAQPALLTVGIAAYRLLLLQEEKLDLLMGLSLGEYTALTAAGVFGFADAVRLVHKRGKLMAEFAAEGGMLASMGVASCVLEDICRNAPGFAACANYNTPGQTVLAGEHAALDFCAAEIKKAGGKTIKLKVFGAFHTPLMNKTAQEFAHELQNIVARHDCEAKVISNVDAEIFDAENYVDILTRHMTSPVRWVSCVEKAIAMGADTFTELGSGNALVNFVRKIDSPGLVKAFVFEAPLSFRA